MQVTNLSLILFKNHPFDNQYYRPKHIRINADELIHDTFQTDLNKIEVCHSRFGNGKHKIIKWI